MRQLVRHGRVELAVRHSGPREDGRPHVLLLHALYGSGEDWSAVESAWPGSFTALDFCGHGDSDWLPGRGYSPEQFVADADAVLAELESEGPVHVAGAGVGAYVALLLAGGRPSAIRAALLLPGEGLAGGGALPEELAPENRDIFLAGLDAADRKPGEPGPDPLVERCDRDVRPVYYVQEFAAAAGPLSIAPMEPTPPWVAAAREHGQASTAPADAGEALAALARTG